MVKPPILYFGAKGTLADRIVATFPEHSGYVEPFAGSLAVLLAKTPTKLEVVNDLDRDLMTFWRVLREQPEALVRAAALTPHSRAELNLSDTRPDDLSDLERARRVWVNLTQGRGASMRYTTGWRQYYDPLSTIAGAGTYMDAYRSRLAAAAERIRNVSLECRDALEVIDDYGSSPATLLYVDPPYLYGSRVGGSSPRYAHEFSSTSDHERLAERLHAASAAVVLSGYPSDLYEELYGDWDRLELSARSDNSAGDRGRVEVLWSNRELGGGRLW